MAYLWILFILHNPMRSPGVSLNLFTPSVIRPGTWSHLLAQTENHTHWSEEVRIHYLSSITANQGAMKAIWFPFLESVISSFMYFNLKQQTSDQCSDTSVMLGHTPVDVEWSSTPESAVVFIDTQQEDMVSYNVERHRGCKAIKHAGISVSVRYGSGVFQKIYEPNDFMADVWAQSRKNLDCLNSHSFSSSINEEQLKTHHNNKQETRERCDAYCSEWWNAAGERFLFRLRTSEKL